MSEYETRHGPQWTSYVYQSEGARRLAVALSVRHDSGAVNETQYFRNSRQTFAKLVTYHRVGPVINYLNGRLRVYVSQGHGFLKPASNLCTLSTGKKNVGKQNTPF